MIKYFENSELLQNTLLPYFCEPEPLKLINIKFSKLNYEKYNTYIQPHGILETYNPKTKLLKSRKNYINSVRNGLYEEYYDIQEDTTIKNSENLLIRKNYKNGKPNGLYELWYNNGKLMESGIYQNGNLDGLCKKWSVRM